MYEWVIVRERVSAQVRVCDYEKRTGACEGEGKGVGVVGGVGCVRVCVSSISFFLTCNNVSEGGEGVLACGCVKS